MRRLVGRLLPIQDRMSLLISKPITTLVSPTVRVKRFNYLLQPSVVTVSHAGRLPFPTRALFHFRALPHIEARIFVTSFHRSLCLQSLRTTRFSANSVTSRKVRKVMTNMASPAPNDRDVLPTEYDYSSLCPL